MSRKLTATTKPTSILPFDAPKSMTFEGVKLTRSKLKYYYDNEHRNFKGVVLFNTDLAGMELSGADLSGADLSGADLSGADLSGADLTEARLCSTDLNGANLEGTDLSNITCDNLNLKGLNLNGAHLNITTFYKLYNQGHRDFKYTNIEGSFTQNMPSRSTIIENANLSHANLNKTTLTPSFILKNKLHGINFWYLQIDYSQDSSPTSIKNIWALLSLDPWFSNAAKRFKLQSQDKQYACNTALERIKNKQFPKNEEAIRLIIIACCFAQAACLEKFNLSNNNSTMFASTAWEHTEKALKEREKNPSSTLATDLLRLNS